jgi:hypothetical protein
MPTFLTSEAELEALYGTPSRAAMVKVSPVVTPHYRALIEASPFCALASAGPEGLDCSPRGDAGPVVRILDERTLAMPDRRGNDRIDTLRNIVRDGRVALMFLIPGSPTILRVNGRAAITADEDVLASFETEGRRPRAVIFIAVAEVYFQCARAVMRAGLWRGGHVDPADLPSVGTMLEALSERSIDAVAYDSEWPERAARSMW